MIVRLVIAGVASLVCLGCAAVPAGPLGRMPEGTGYVGDVTPEQAHRFLESDGEAVLLDVRTQAEYVFVGHPDKAVNIPIELWDEDTYSWLPNPAFDARVLARFSKETPLVLMCRSGNRSRDAAKRLEDLGFLRVFNMIESFEGDRDPATGLRTVNGWKNRGLPWTYSVDPKLLYWP